MLKVYFGSNIDRFDGNGEETWAFRVRDTPGALDRALARANADRQEDEEPFTWAARDLDHDLRPCVVLS